MVAVWPAIHAERAALLADLDTLTAEQWATPSLCAQWSVKQVFGHIIATAQMTPAKFFLGMAGSGFRFGRYIEANVERFSAGTPAEMLATFRGLSTGPATRRARTTRGSARRSCTPRTSGVPSGCTVTTRSRR